jgi:multiple sugar transport system permease protein
MGYLKHREKAGDLSNFQFALLLTLPVVLFLVTIIIYPLLYSIWASFQQIIFFGGYRTNFVGFKNYIDVLHSPSFWNGAIVSLRFMVESVVLTLSVGLGIALTLKGILKGRGIMYSIIIFPWAASCYGAGIIFKYFWGGIRSFPSALSFILGEGRSINMLDEHIVIEAISIGNAWHLAPLVALFLLANMQTIPTRLYDMAEIDNLGGFRKFYYVTLPYLRYSLFIFTSIVAVLSLKMFDYIFVQTGGGPGTASAALTYEIYKESFQNLNLGYGAAMSFYLLFLILALTILNYLFWGRKMV